jgi:membrane associated rhomboid family serine protease
MSNIFSDITNNYRNGNSFTKLLYINLSFFIIYTLIWVPYPEIEKTINYLAFPSKTEILIHKPWTFLSYMFIHTDPLHILSNMVFLYFGSKLFLQYFNNKQLITTYILGGICGAIFFKLLFNIFPEYPTFNADKPLIGASAGVFAIMIAASTYRPNSLIPLPFIGNVKLKHIAWVAIILFYLGIGNSDNPGGHIAHLGGALFGYIYIKQLQKGNDISNGFSNFLNKLVNTFKTKSKLKTVHKRSKSDKQFNKEKTEQQKAVDLVLEKISKSGYASLSKEEKATLFSASKK